MHILSNINKLYTRLRGCENEATTQMIIPYIRALKGQLNNLKNQMPDYVAENSTSTNKTSCFDMIPTN